MRHKGHHLDGVAEYTNQLVDTTVDWLVSHTHTPEQLVLNVTREQTLRSLQRALHDHLTSPQVKDETVWRLVSTILATTVCYLLATESDSNRYKQRRRWPPCWGIAASWHPGAAPCYGRRADNQVLEAVGRAQAV
jgi:hypothetical protein